MTARTLQALDVVQLVRTPVLYPAAIELGAAEPLIVEVGPGRGDFLFHLAERNPAATVVGIEIKRKRVDKLIARTERRRLANVRLIQDDARHALPQFFADASVDEIHVNFPDPWPKKRHAKNRAVSPAFLAECARILKPNGHLFFATDSRPYADWVAENAQRVPRLKNCYDSPMLADLPDAFPTFFAEKWRAEGRTLTYQKYRRV